MKLYKLTITKTSDKIILANALKKINAEWTVQERLKIANNLPFVDEDSWAYPEHIKSVLSPVCEYVYEQAPFPGNYDVCRPPWESPKYIVAKNWYNTLSSEDQKKIDILVQANIPWG